MLQLRLLDSDNSELEMTLSQVWIIYFLGTYGPQEDLEGSVNVNFMRIKLAQTAKNNGPNMLIKMTGTWQADHQESNN